MSYDIMKCSCSQVCTIIHVLVERKIARIIYENVFYHIYERRGFITKRNIFENRIISIMFSQVTVVLLSCHLSLSTTPITIYKNAQLVPINANYKLTDLFLIDSQNKCICQCLTNVKCLTVTYINFNETCSLFSVQLRTNWLRVAVTIMDASVISFRNNTSFSK